ncbi:MAG: DUF1028 domain-containing protein [Burkholderiales bacterium]
MTYCIVARCAQSGSFGLAIASQSINIGLHCYDSTRAHVGATITYGSAHRGSNSLALRLLALGFSARHTLAELRANDPRFESRQIAIVDRDGAAAAHSGSELRQWSGHRIGNGYVVAGDALSGEKVLDAMAAAFLAVPEASLDQRLLEALEAARDTARPDTENNPRPERSCALIVQGRHPYTDTDLRVDMLDGAIADLRRLYDEYQPYAAYYDERGKYPRNAIPQREFADILDAKKG